MAVTLSSLWLGVQTGYIGNTDPIKRLIQNIMLASDEGFGQFEFLYLS